MKKGKEIQDLHDIRSMITYLCVTQDEYTLQDIYLMAKENMKGSYFMADKLLKTITKKVVTFLIKHNLLVEYNGIYYQACNADKFNEAETQNIFAD